MSFDIHQREILLYYWYLLPINSDELVSAGSTQNVKQNTTSIIRNVRPTPNSDARLTWSLFVVLSSTSMLVCMIPFLEWLRTFSILILLHGDRISDGNLRSGTEATVCRCDNHARKWKLKGGISIAKSCDGCVLAKSRLNRQRLAREKGEWLSQIQKAVPQPQSKNKPPSTIFNTLQMKFVSWRK